MIRALTAGMAVAAIVVAAGLAQGAAPSDDKVYDLDGDGAISILDLTILAQHFLEQVGTPDACYTQGQYATPLVVAGYTFPQYLLVPPGDPAADGTPRRLVPC